jgi:hypothetical protein
VTRRKSWTAILALLIVATALTTAVIAPKADASALRGKLRHARRELRTARLRLTAAEAAVAATLSAATDEGSQAPVATTTDPATTTPDPAPTAAPSPPLPPTLAQLQAKVVKERRAVRRWRRRVRRLATRVRLQRRLAAWESHGTWKPIIRIAAARYHVKADGMYRMMMRESGGRRFAGSSTAFKGLFQYYTGTWAASWNPYRHDSIYDGSSQIFATAYAIHRGMGAQMWTTTWASQY